MNLVLNDKERELFSALLDTLCSMTELEKDEQDLINKLYGTLQQSAEKQK